MLVRFVKSASFVALATAAALWAFGWGSTAAHAQCACGQHADGHAGHERGAAGHHSGSAESLPADHNQPTPPHGGQLTDAAPLTFEVVYQPQEIRVYLYHPLPQPVSARGVKGEVSLRRADGRVIRAALRHVAESDQQDHLSAPIDLSGATNGALTATVELTDLPLPKHPRITFTQAVALSKAKPQVTLAPFGQGDQAGVARQRVCPVTGAELGSMGDPIKVLVGGQPLYLCCQGCLAKVQRDPETYLRKAGQASQGQ